MNYIIDYLESSDQPKWYGYMIATFLFLAFFLKSFLQQYSFLDIFKVGIIAINIVNISILRKILALRTSSKKYFDVGRLMNYITVDTQQIFLFLQYGNIIAYSPIIILVAFVLIIKELSWIGILTPFFFFIGLIL